MYVTTNWISDNTVLPVAQFHNKVNRPGFSATLPRSATSELEGAAEEEDIEDGEEATAEDEEIDCLSPSSDSSTDSSEAEYQAFSGDEDDFNPRQGEEVDRWTE